MYFPNSEDFFLKSKFLKLYLKICTELKRILFTESLIFKSFYLKIND